MWKVMTNTCYLLTKIILVPFFKIIIINYIHEMNTCNTFFLFFIGWLEAAQNIL